MKNIKSFSKLNCVFDGISSVSRRCLVLLTALLTLGVGQMWGKRIYLDLNGQNWTDASALIYVHEWEGGTGSTWPGHQMTNKGGNIYYYDIDDNNTKVKFSRVKPDDKSTVWNSTGDLTFGSNNIFTLSSYTDGSWSSTLATWIGNSYIVANGAWYNAAGTGQSNNFNSYDLGAITSLSLGGQVQTFGQKWGAENNAEMYYQFDDNSSSTIELVWFKFADNNNFYGMGGTGSQHVQTATDIDITALDPGSHSLAVWFHTSDGDQWDSHNGSNYVATFTINPIITFNATDGSGSMSNQTVTYNTNTTLNSNTFTAPTGYQFGGWATSSANAAAGTVAYANGATIKATAHQTLYAIWTPKTYTVTLKPNGPAADDKTITATYLSSTHTSLTNFTYSGYNLLGYYTASSGGYRVINAEGTYVASAPNSTGTIINSSSQWIYDGAQTLYAQWEEVSKCTVTYNGNGSDGGSVPTDATNYNPGDNVTVKDNTGSLTRTGYTFAGWTDNSSGTGTVYGPSYTTTYSSIAANVVFYAKWTEDMPLLSTSCHYNAGSPGYAAPTVSGSATTVGYATTRIITATTPGTGYTFAGWTLTHCERISGDANSLTITIRSDGSGENASAVANYEENLSSTFYIAGATSARSPFSGWGASGISMSKKSGYSTTEIYYCTVHVTNVAGDGEFEFKPYNSTGNVHYGHDNYWVTRENHADITCWGDNDKSLWFKPDIAGDYEFKIDNTGTYPVLTVTFPTSYAVNFGVSPAGAAGAPTNDNSLSNGGLVLDGTSVTFTHATANTGYTWSHWDVGGSNVGTGDTYTRTINAATTVTAVYTENSYATTVSATNGSVTPASPSISHHTGTELTATPNTNYVFESWSVSGGGLAVKSPSTLTYNPATFTATSTGGTITANFADQWAVCGIGSWSTYNGMPLKSGTVYEGTISLTAGSHTFKVVDRNTNTWYTEEGKTITRTANTASATTTTGEGNNITITADRAGDYTFTFDTSDKSLTVTYPADPTYTVTVIAGAHGSITTPASGNPRTVSAGEFTPAAIVATADDGYVFSRWTVTSGEASNVTIADNTAASTTVTATGNVTLTATFINNWAIAGDDETYFANWSTTAHGFDNFTTVDGKSCGYIEMTLPANTQFTFKVYYHDGGVWYGNNTTTQYMTYAENNNQYWQFETGDDKANCGLTTAGAGTYRFTWNETDKQLKVTFPTSYTVTFGSSTGGTEVTASGSTSDSITTGKYVVAGENVTFTQTPSTGYTFAAWYNNPEKSGDPLGNDPEYTITGISADTAVYAGYNANLYTVSIAYKCDGTTIYTSSVINNATVEGVAIEAPDIVGYSFSGWSADTGITYGDSYASGTTTSSAASTTLYATHEAAITANYTEHKAVYFKNTLGWSEVYVTYDAYWNKDSKDNGTGNQEKYYHKMTRIGESDIYYDYIPDTYISSWAWNIAFNDRKLLTDREIPTDNGDYEFYNVGNVIFRMDFDKNATMFVPRAEGNNTYTKNGATYYSSDYITQDSKPTYKDSYWMVYNSTESGYALSGSFEETTPWPDQALTATSAGKSEFSYTINLAENTTYSFGIRKLNESSNDNSTWYRTGTTITKDNCSNIEFVASATTDCQITTTAAGNYTFTLTCGEGRLYLSVDYPLSVDDYRFVYTHDGKSKPSDIIRNKPGSESIVSFYIKNWYNKSTSSGAYTAQSLKLQRCSNISPETWYDVAECNTLLNNETLKDTSGVYNFKLTQPAEGVPTISNVTYEGGYKGNFYIRTDAAEGGWNAYTDFADNRLTYSEYSEKNGDYTHYFMKYVTAGKNIKFCIANDYSRCISDTLADDTCSSETLPVNANIRYTWNHETNAISRAYIGAASASDFLRLIGNSTNKLFTASTGDGYVTEQKFADDQNWIYHADVYATPNTRIKLTAVWNGKTQYFKGESETPDYTFDAEKTDVLIGGSSDTTRFKMRVIYDFKTDRLTTAWLPERQRFDNETSVTADLLVIRDADSRQAPSLFTLTDNGKVNLIGHIVFALEMNPADIINDSHTGYRNGLRSQLFQVCLPYDVNVNDIYGLPGYGTKWVIQLYSGEMRAKLSWTPYIKDFWGTVRLSDGGIIKAGTGFVISHNLEYEDFRDASGTYSPLYLYFPSVDKDGGYTINQPKDYGTTTYAELTCNHAGREFIDSDWRLTGLPGFYPAKVATGIQGVHGVRVGEGVNYNDVRNDSTPNWLYEWGGIAGNYIVKNPKSYALNPTSAYFIQYHGEVTWDSAHYEYSETPASVAARRMPAEDYTNAQGEYIYSNEYLLTMHDAEGELTDQAYIVVHPDATEGYTRNEDFGKYFAENAAQIYTLSNGNRLAANSLPDTVTAVPVALSIAEDGEYTIRLDKDGQFNNAVLEDRYTQTSTNLTTAAEGYTFEAEAGRTEDRFVLHFAPQQPGTATAVDETAAGALRVTTIDGQIIVESSATNAKDAVVYLYDASGKTIYSTPFRQGISLPAPSAGVYLVRVGDESHRVVVGQ